MRWGTTTVLAVAAYAAATLLNFAFGVPPTYASPIYPAAGIAVALRVLLGRRILPAIWIGNALSNILSLHGSALTLPGAAAIIVGACAATAEAELAALVMRRFSSPRSPFGGPRDVVAFLAGCLTGALASAVPGAVSVWASGFIAAPELPSTLAIWLFGDAVGIAVFTPLILAWQPRAAARHAAWHAALADTAMPAWMACMLILAGVLVVAALNVVTGYEIEYLYLLVLLWAGFHAGPRGTTTATALIGVAAVLTTVHGFGGFAGGGLTRTLLLLQCFVGAIAFVGLTVLATRAAQREAELALVEHNRTLEWRIADRTAELAAKNHLLAEKQRRIDEDLAQAHTLQTAILPTDFSALATVDIAAAMIPAQEMSGDFYDLFPLAGGRQGIVIGDVSGKGVAAAFFMAVALTLMRQIAASGAAPADCIARVNDELCRDNPLSMFVTLFYADLDPATGDLVCVNAGHCPALVVSPDGRVGEVPSVRNPALGIMPEFEFGEQRVVLDAGTVLFLYTDGVTEAFDTSEEQFQDSRLRDALARHAHDTPRALLAAVVDGVTAFAAGTAQSDDITCLAIRRAMDHPSHPVQRADAGSAG